MANETKEKKTRTPRTAESITAGALSLPLAERVELCKQLKESIQAEVEQAQKAAESAKQIAGL